MTRSDRSRHTGPKSSHFQRKKHKKARRSVALVPSPVNARYIRPDFANDNDVFDNESSDDETDHSESDSLLWNEESTLLDALMDKPKAQLGDDPSVFALSERLRDAFMNRGRASKSELARIFVSTNTEVRNCFKVLDDKLEPTFGKEIIRFNTACKLAERKCLRIAELTEKVETHIVECKRLEEQIVVKFAERDALYTRFQEFAENTLNPVLGRLNNLPARNERWMAQMSEDLKALEKKYKKIAASKELQNYLGLG